MSVQINRTVLFLAVYAIFVCSAGFAAHAEDARLDKSAPSLAEIFDNPPASAKPVTWWHWMNGNVTKEGITLDLEWMKRIGLGGAQVFEVGQVRIPGEAVHRSAYWQSCVQHAIQECARLGLEFGMHNCSGWNNSGGPWVESSDSMKKLVFSRATVDGGTLNPAAPQQPVPEAMLPFSHQNSMNSTLEKFGLERTNYTPWYSDVAVYAWPAGDAQLMREAAPVLNKGNAGVLFDGDSLTGLNLDDFLKDKDAELVFRFKEPFTAQSIYLLSGEGGLSAGEIELAAEINGTFQTVKLFSMPKNGGPLPEFQGVGFDPVTTKAFRLRFLKLVKSKVSAELRELEMSGEPCIEQWPVKAGFLRGRGEDGNRTPKRTALKRENILNLTGRLRPDGTLDWQVPPGRWMVLRIGATSTGKMNHPSAIGGVGPEVDKFDLAALERFFKNGPMQLVVDLAGDQAGKALKAFGTDSWEVGSQNWTPDLLNQFRMRRGYDAAPWLPCLAGQVLGSSDESERFLWDWRQTLSDLFAEHFYGGFQAFCHKYGMRSFAEPYNNGNYNNLQMGGYVDDVAPVFWTDHRFSEEGIHAMVSVVNTYGLGRVESEAYTSTADYDMWRQYPAKMKARGDTAFAFGISRYVFHTSAHQPWVDVVPGMTMGPFGINFTRNTTWAEQARSWIEYITRCQALLQSGLYAADVLFFAGEGSPNQFNGNLKKLGLPEGIGFDGCDANVLLKRAAVKAGRIVLPDGMNYKLLVLSDDATMTVPLAEKLRDLVRDGITVLVKQRPVRTPGLGDDAALRTVIDELFGDLDGKTVKNRHYGKGQLVMGRPLASLLEPPDYTVTVAPAEGIVRTIHRYTDEANFYFVACDNQVPVQFEMSFRIPDGQPEIWNPYRKTRERAAGVRHENGRTIVLLDFDPSDAVFVVFPVRPTTDVKHLKSNVADFQSLNGSWHVDFQKGRGAPASVELPQLIDLSTHTDEGVRFFSGTATYTKTFEIPASALAKPSSEISIDLGRVEVLAEVILNGRNLGVLWKAPFRVAVGDALKPGENRVEIRVTNLWINRLIGDERQFPQKNAYWWDVEERWPDWLVDSDKSNPSGRIGFVTWPYWKGTDQLMPSGLIGPVRLISMVNF